MGVEKGHEEGTCITAAQGAACPGHCCSGHGLVCIAHRESMMSACTASQEVQTHTSGWKLLGGDFNSKQAKVF